MKSLSWFVIAAVLIVGSFSVQTVVFSTKAYAGKMNGKPGGGSGSPKYDQPGMKKKKK